MKSALSIATLLSILPATLAANLTLVQSYQGQNFFSGWDFTSNFDNTTNGDVEFVDPTLNSSYSNLAFVDDAGHAIVKVDNTSFVPFNQKRNTIKIMSKDFFDVGTVWLFDANHLPFGCAVWPAFWTKGLDWPRQGEIDIVEGINLMTNNQMALHTFSGCSATSGTDQTGTAGTSNCNSTDGAGCTVSENAQNSFGAGFASAGGGVWATQFDVSGIFIWFWTRASVPPSITSATDSIDISSWGPPSAAYPASGCDIGNFFGAQQLVIDITLCGDWAGVPSLYVPTCGQNAANQSAPNVCYVNSVINNGSPNFDQAYFEINYVKAFAVNSSVVSVPSGGSLAPTATGSSSPSASGSSGSSGSGSGTSSGAVDRKSEVWYSIVGAGVLAVAGLVIGL